MDNSAAAELLETTHLIYTVLVGACLGSFVNVVVARLPTHESLVSPGSRCPSCKTPIRWFDNIPILSWLILRGRCRVCRIAISPRYVIVETLTALLCWALFIRLGWSFPLLMWVPLVAALVAITFLDIDHYWVPDVIVFPSMVWVLVWAFLPDGIGIQALLGVIPALGLWLFAWLFMRITGREGMGLGDVKLLALLGMVLGPLPTVVALFLASVQGSVVGIASWLSGGHKPADPVPMSDGWVPPARAIPFGPFLVLGALEIVLLPDVFANLPARLIAALAGY